jgi:hypothetical protein
LSVSYYRNIYRALFEVQTDFQTSMILRKINFRMPKSSIVEPMTYRRCIFILTGLLCASLLGVATAGNYPVVKVKSLPDDLRQVWNNLKPEMQATSHCAAAYDSQTDANKMVLKCSIYIKMSAEGERRAMRYCEEERAERRIKSPCRLVEE